MRRRPSPWTRPVRLGLDRLEGREVPAVFTVTTASDDPLDAGLTLREAISQANSTPGADEIRFAVPVGSTITIDPNALTPTPSPFPQGPLPTISDPLTITGPGTAALTVSGGKQVRVFAIGDGAGVVTITDLTIADGLVQGSGAGILNQADGTSASLTVSRVAFAGNQALAFPGNPLPFPAPGGAILSNGPLTVTDSTFTGNTASGDGGAVYATTGVTVTGSTFVGNTAGAGSGGAVAVFGFGGTVQFADSTFTGNRAAAGRGGGLYLEGPGGRLDRLTFSGNAALHGGGLGATFNNETAVLAVTRSTFDGNAATQTGGGVAVLRNFSGPVQLANFDLEDATLTRNTAAAGGGGLEYLDTVPDGSPSIARLTNSIVAGNSDPTAPDVAGPFISRGVNLFSSTAGGTGFSAADLVAADPLLSPLADNGGLTQTVAPRAGSPALGAADPTVSAAGLTTDQRGRPRTTPRDIGAVQAQRPTATGDGPYQFPFNGGTVAAPGVLANDQNNDQLGPLTAVLVAPPPSTAGTLVLNPDGSFSFTPINGFSGTASFVYVATDGVTQSASATVTFTVVVNPPTAVQDTFVVPPNQPTTIPAPGILANDIPGDGSGPLTALFFSPLAPTGAGTLTPNADGSFTFIPTAGFTGTVGFSYSVNDGLSTSLTGANVFLRVQAPPTAVDDSYAVTAGGTLTIPAPGVLINDVRNGGNGAAVVSLAQGVPSGSGTLILNADGSFAFTPAAGVSGPVTFQYRVTDGAGVSNVATVTLNVGAIPALVAPDRSYGPVRAGTALTVAATDGLLSGVQSPTGRPLRVINAFPTVGSGSLSVAADGSFTFTLADAAVGSVTFTYQLTDDFTQPSNIGTVTVAVNTAPLAPVSRFTAYGTGAGVRARVSVVRPGLGDLTLLPFEDTFLGGARVAVADLTRDGVDDIVVGAGPGGGPRVIVYDGASGAQVANFFAYEETFRGGAHVAAADSVTAKNQRTSLLVVGAGSFADRPGSPRVRAFRDFFGLPSGDDQGTAPVDFIAYNPSFQGGVRVAAGDLDGDGTIEIVTIAGPSGGPDLRVWDTGQLSGTSPALRQQLSGLGADTGYRGGAFVAISGGAIVVTPDSVPELAATLLGTQAGLLPDTGGLFSPTAIAVGTTRRSPSVNVFLPTGVGTGRVQPEPLAIDLGDPGFLGGVRVTAGVAPGGGTGAAVLVGYGPGGRGLVRQFAFNPAGGVSGVAQVLDRTTERQVFPFGDLGSETSIYVGEAPLPFLRTSSATTPSGAGPATGGV